MDHPEDDDRFIRKAIEDADVSSVQRMILVSTDGGFVPYLIEKEQQGIEIIVMATRSLDASTRNHTLSRSLCEFFPFVELEDHYPLIMGRTWHEEGDR